MTPAPEPNLTAAMLQRAGDLATYMDQRGLRIATAAGLTPSGLPVTVVMAVGGQAEVLLDVGEKLTAHIVKAAEEAAERAKSN